MLSRMSAPATRSSGSRSSRQPADPCVLKNDLGWALGALSRSYLQAVSATFAGVPGGPRGYQVLAAAAREEPGSQLALAQHLGVDRTVMTCLLDSLAEAGLIERRPDPADRRARRIAATARGLSLLDGLGARLRVAEDQVLAGLDDEDRQSFRALLQRVAVHAATALDSASPDGAARPPCAEPAPGNCSGTGSGAVG
jgi:DNA-binding MarR family transcriptional regulator